MMAAFAFLNGNKWLRSTILQTATDQAVVARAVDNTVRLVTVSRNAVVITVHDWGKMQLMGVWGFLPLELWCVCVCVCVCACVCIIDMPIFE